jgi:hypothetical protein
VQVPFEVRADLARMKEMPVPSQFGGTVPLGELGDFYQIDQEQVIYHKDLRRVEYVTGETTGRLGAPIYGMFDVIDSLENYTTPDGIELKGTWTAPPDSDAYSGFEWAGEWTVTYETFRDMGMAFGAAIILIYMLVVMEFGNFSLPAIIMAPIPLTLIGIIPGHWAFGAEFTATSMIGFIALAGIIVRNSILLVDFTRIEVEGGRPVTESVLLACKARTRPILVTALALVGGSGVIIFDPIFKGMAISLAFGVLVSTVLTLVVIPLGAITVRRVFAHKTVDPSGATIYGELPYDPILEGDYRHERGEDEKDLIDYIVIGLSVSWIFILAMIFAFRDFSADLYRAIVRLLKRKPKTQPPTPPTPTAPEPSTPPENPPVADDEPAVAESGKATPEPETKAIQSAAESAAVAVTDTTPRTDPKPADPAPAAPKVKNVQSKSNPPKKAESKKTSLKKRVAKAKQGPRRGIRLKSDIDDDD